MEITITGETKGTAYTKVYCRDCKYLCKLQGTKNKNCDCRYYKSGKSFIEKIWKMFR